MLLKLALRLWYQTVSEFEVPEFERSEDIAIYMQRLFGG